MRSNVHQSKIGEYSDAAIKNRRRVGGNKRDGAFSGKVLTSGRWWCLRLNSEVSCKTFFLNAAKMSACRYN
jgi:hypothetical protein